MSFLGFHEASVGCGIDLKLRFQKSYVKIMNTRLKRDEDVFIQDVFSKRSAKLGFYLHCLISQEIGCEKIDI